MARVKRVEVFSIPVDFVLAGGERGQFQATFNCPSKQQIAEGLRAMTGGTVDPDSEKDQLVLSLVSVDLEVEDENGMLLNAEDSRLHVIDSLPLSIAANRAYNTAVLDLMEKNSRALSIDSAAAPQNKAKTPDSEQKLPASG